MSPRRPLASSGGRSASSPGSSTAKPAGITRRRGESRLPLTSKSEALKNKEGGSEVHTEAAKRAAHGLFNVVVEIAAWEIGRSDSHPFYGAIKWSPDHFNRGLNVASFNDVSAEEARLAVGRPKNPGMNKWNPVVIESEGEDGGEGLFATQSKRRRLLASAPIKAECDHDAATAPATPVRPAVNAPIDMELESSPAAEVTNGHTDVDLEEQAVFGDVLADIDRNMDHDM
ncbi:hypothetical protein GGI42DRAFT_367031 [Trichoderma sp. SZMC 28013]